MSSWVTSATRRSRSVLAAVSTATSAACSHDAELVPTTSVKRYTLSAMSRPFVSALELPGACSPNVRASSIRRRGTSRPPPIGITVVSRDPAGRRRHAVRSLRPHGPGGHPGRAAARGAAAAGGAVRPRPLPRLPPGRAPRDAAGPGAVAEPAAGRDRPAHQPPTLRRPGHGPAAVPPDPADRGDHHARPPERRPLPARRRPRRLPHRGVLLSGRARDHPAPLPRDARDRAGGADLGHAHLSRRALRDRRGADGPQAPATAAPAAVVRDQRARPGGLGGAAGGENRVAA